MTLQVDVELSSTEIRYLTRLVLADKEKNPHRLDNVRANVEYLLAKARCELFTQEQEEENLQITE